MEIVVSAQCSRDKMADISQTAFSNAFSYTLGREYRVMR